MQRQNTISLNDLRRVILWSTGDKMGYLERAGEQGKAHIFHYRCRRRQIQEMEFFKVVYRKKL